MILAPPGVSSVNVGKVLGYSALQHPGWVAQFHGSTIPSVGSAGSCGSGGRRQPMRTTPIGITGFSFRHRTGNTLFALSVSLLLLYSLYIGSRVHFKMA